jgi:hypothetical protein
MMHHGARTYLHIAIRKEILRSFHLGLATYLKGEEKEVLRSKSSVDAFRNKFTG